ncbi:hypothetical protein CCHR01_13561 [Colletotrichum chrysophilum]|uniref:Uncharacterized protein n=1 Tax=Colletotrichum chrysophilum TaxID=1836956 RepID=A0AAD9A9R4_9PEZI|nr:hypothetical protein CCHR01_13561 [Colletotrichum chrysophilum]
MNTNVAVSEVMNRDELPSLGIEIYKHVSKGEITGPEGSLAVRRREKRMSRAYDWRQRLSMNPMSSPVIDFQDWELLRANEPSKLT